MRKYMTAAALEPTDTGSLQVNVVSAENNFPIRDAEVSIAYKGDPESTVESTNTNSDVYKRQSFIIPGGDISRVRGEDLSAFLHSRCV